MSTVKDTLFKAIASSHTDHKSKSGTKITVIGVGQVGMAAAFTIMVQGVCNEISLVDIAKDKLQGELMDLQHGQHFLRKCKIQASDDYSVSADSDIVVITAGARQREGESRLNLVQRNVDIMAGMIPKIVKYSPNCIILVASNPVDILAYVAWKLSGFPSNRVFGSGTMLDSARFRFLLGEKLEVSASSCHGYVIGEHGDSSVAVWSAVNVAGQTLATLYPDIGTDKDPENFAQIHKDVIDSAYKIIRLKGYTSWAIGVAVSTLCSDILRNQHSVKPVSVLAKGMYGIEREVFMSLPCVVSSSGVMKSIPQTLSKMELDKLLQSARTMTEIIDSIKWAGK